MHESESPDPVSAKDESTKSAKDYVERELRADADLTYTELRERAARLGLNVPRFLYGSTRRQLGLAPRPEPAPPASQASAGQASVRESEPEAAEAQAAEAVMHATAPDTEATSPMKEADAAGEVETPPAPTSATSNATSNSVEQRPKGSAFAFTVDALRITPGLSYQDLKARAALAGLSLPPIVYGRAKALLGLVPTRPRRSKTALQAPRLLKQVDSAAAWVGQAALEGVRPIEQFVATVRELEVECKRLRAALAAALEAADEALGADA